MPDAFVRADIPRVLHAVVGMNRGGYETLIMNLYRNIDRTRLQFDFVSSLDGCFDKEIRDLGGKIHRIPFITKTGPFAYAKALRRIFEDNPRYRIVHSHMDKFSGMVMREAKKSGVPVRIAHSHSTKNEGGIFFRAVKNYYGRLVPRNATELMACSYAAAKWMFGKYAASSTVVPSGIALADYAPDFSVRTQMRRALGVEKCFVIGHVGRFTAPKNHRFLLDVFRAVHCIRQDTRLLLAGDGILLRDIQRRAADLGLSDSVCFLGARSDISALMQAFDVFLFPSLFEGFGIALIEAQASGLPVVASGDIPPEALLCGQTRQLSLAQSPGEWASAVLSAKRPVFDISPLLPYDIRKVASDMQQFYLHKHKTAALGGK